MCQACERDGFWQAYAAYIAANPTPRSSFDIAAGDSTDETPLARAIAHQPPRAARTDRE